MVKVKIMNSRKLCLVANMTIINSKSIVVLAHGFTNNKSSEGRFDKTIKKLNIDGLIP